MSGVLQESSIWRNLANLAQSPSGLLVTLTMKADLAGCFMHACSSTLLHSRILNTSGHGHDPNGVPSRQDALGKAPSGEQSCQGQSSSEVSAVMHLLQC